ALGGAPGVRSARYAEDTGFAPDTNMPTDERNNACLLHALHDVPNGSRTARYHCVLAAARDGGIMCTTDGTVEGEILTTARGSAGFGYDPLFLLPESRKTMAELDALTKLAFSHRGRALKKLLAKLRQKNQETPSFT
ncbi:MAG TPA: non-canonical purine NTP pyrophosphatase, partial [Edaphobacter sp.]|nr:non-canonical purine NTP pyrophosphatase [Edaphobacter sp.]